jgi:hypothetical protein
MIHIDINWKISASHSVIHLSFCPFILSATKSFNLGYNFWMVGTRTLIFHMSVPYDMTFLWVQKCLTLPWCWTHYWKLLTLAISFEWWILWLCYFTWINLLTRPFSGYQKIWLCDLDLGCLTYLLKTLTLAISFKSKDFDISLEFFWGISSFCE